MQAVADALSLLANIVMAWNTAQMQTVLDRWKNRRQVISNTAQWERSYNQRTYKLKLIITASKLRAIDLPDVSYPDTAANCVARAESRYDRPWAAP